MHRLVASAFIRNTKNLKYVNHKDGVKSNNVVDNLEWTTGSQNAKHAFKNKLRCNVGENNSCAKLKKSDVIKIRQLYNTKKYTQLKLSSLFGVARETIRNIVNNKTWNHV